MRHLLTAVSASPAPSLMEDRNSLFLALGESKKTHQRNLTQLLRNSITLGNSTYIYCSLFHPLDFSLPNHLKSHYVTLN